jgi:MFS family permease
MWWVKHGAHLQCVCVDDNRAPERYDASSRPSFTVPLQWLLLIRFMVGIGLGGVPVAFALFAEFCPVAGRGGWLIALQAFWTFGSMAEAAVAWGVLMTLGWRVLLALSAAPFGELPAKSHRACMHMQYFLTVGSRPYISAASHAGVTLQCCAWL